ncbi:MAG: invasion associated locus B family protein [Emcibacteraceae bacterium]|nr:invasion associated locus B family protein [Emcibacteraceae bacterium]
MNKFVTWLSITISFIIIATSTAKADSRQLLSSFRDWDAFVLKTDAGETVCYMISVPKAKSPKSLRHGNPFVTITHKPSREIRNEFNFIAGYRFQKGSAVRVVIDKTAKDSLFTEQDGAWAYDSKQDDAIVASMKRGNSLSLNAKSGRGNATSYRFSLSGFTAAHNAITSACR